MKTPIFLKTALSAVTHLAEGMALAQ